MYPANRAITTCEPALRAAKDALANTRLSRNNRPYVQRLQAVFHMPLAQHHQMPTSRVQHTATFAAIPTATSHGLAQAIILVVLIAGAIAVYATLLAAFGITGWRETMAALRRSPDLPA